MQPLLLHEKAAWLALVVLAGGWVATEAALQLNARLRGARTQADWTLFAALGSIAVATTALAVPLAWIRATQLGGGYWPVAVGLALYAAGVALRLWALLTLGRLFTLGVGIQAGHHLVGRLEPEVPGVGQVGHPPVALDRALVNAVRLGHGRPLFPNG